MQSDRFAQMPQHGVLSLFFTAGFPRRDDMMPILEQLQAVRVDMVEVGFPFSDPVADGPTIQASSQQALANGGVRHATYPARAGRRCWLKIALLRPWAQPAKARR